MKGIIKNIKHRTFPDKNVVGKDVSVWDVWLDGHAGKKYTTYDKQAGNWQIGQETPEFEAKKTGDYFDEQNSVTIENFKMILPKSQTSGFQQNFRGKSHEEIIMTAKTMTMAYAKDLVCEMVQKDMIKKPPEVEQWTSEIFKSLIKLVLSESEK